MAINDYETLTFKYCRAKGTSCDTRKKCELCEHNPSDYEQTEQLQE